MTDNLADPLLKSGQVIRAAFDYEAERDNSKVLSCRTGDLFIIIKAAQPEEWLYVINCEGSLGYVPANFVEPHDSVSRSVIGMNGVLQVLFHVSCHYDGSDERHPDFRAG